LGTGGDEFGGVRIEITGCDGFEMFVELVAEDCIYIYIFREKDGVGELVGTLIANPES